MRHEFRAFRRRVRDPRVDTGRFRVPLEEAARAILAAFNGVLSLRQWGTTSAREVAATSDLVFTALISELSKKR
jgi:hypothetical protein